jgi:hypothetical protein
MRDERLEVSVTFDERRGYVAMVPDLAEPITALRWRCCGGASRSGCCPTVSRCGSCSTAPRGRSATDRLIASAGGRADNSLG